MIPGQYDDVIQGRSSRTDRGLASPCRPSPAACSFDSCRGPAWFGEERTTLVDTLSLAGMVWTLLICSALPVGAALYLHRRMGISGRAILVGAVVFIVSQLILRIPILQYLSGQPWYQERMTSILFSIAVLALSAGIFEEVGRFLGFSWGLRQNLRWKDGVAFGIGHGGIEAAALVGTTYLNNLVMSLHINRGTFAGEIAPQLGAQAPIIQEQLVATPPHMFFLAGWERLTVMLLHIGLSILVLQAVRSGRGRYLLYAIAAHTTLNIPAVLGPAWNIGMELIQVFLTVLAACSIFLIMRARPAMENQLLEQLPRQQVSGR